MGKNPRETMKIELAWILQNKNTALRTEMTKEGGGIRLFSAEK